MFRTCGVGVRPCTRNRTKCAAGVLAGHSAIAFRRRESRRGSTIVEGVVVMAKGYSMCVRAVLGQYIGSPWRGVPGDNHHSIPGNSCMCRSRAPVRAALRFVEIANKAICDEELSSSSPRARAVRPSWFVMSVHSCPQPTTNNWGPPCRAEPAKKSPMRARVSGQGWQGRAGQFGQRRERVCAFRGCGLSRYG